MGAPVVRFLSRFISENHKNAVIYFLANALGAIFPFLLLPLLTYRLSPENYGIYGLFQSVVILGVPIVGLVLSSTVGVEFEKRESTDFPRYLSVCVLIGACSLVITLFVATLFYTPLHALLKLDYQFLVLALLSSKCQALLSMMLVLCAMTRNPRRYLYWRAGYSSVWGIVTLLALLIASNKLSAVIWAQSFIACIAIGGILVSFSRSGWISRDVRRDDAEHAVRYSLPLVVHILAANAATQIVDRLFVSHYLGLRELGIYNLAQQLSMVMWLFVTSLNQVWMPWYYARIKHDDHHHRQTIVKTTYWMFAFLFAAGAVLSVVVWLVFPYVFTDEFMEARNLFPILVMAFVFNGMYMLVSAVLFYHGRTGRIAFSTLSTCLVSIVLNWLLVPLLGMYGAAISTMLAMAVMCLMVWHGSWNYNLPWALWKLTKEGKQDFTP